jgi:hypothetical protein
MGSNMQISKHNKSVIYTLLSSAKGAKEQKIIEIRAKMV